MVMPRYPGHLGHWLRRSIEHPDENTLRDAISFSTTLAHTLAEVHKVKLRGGTMVHRDVKPENVFIDTRGRLVLGDFGCAMTIDGLRAVELALYGTPMWAPLDQILPGQAIPDPTWDTYALCVFLYAAVTGARPAYQADPRELLTAHGRELWSLAKATIEAPREQRTSLARQFCDRRVGTHATQLVDCTGRAALNTADKRVLANGVARLASLSGLTEEAATRAHRSLWRILVRGLSPVSHPSPPNRFRDGDELAELLEDLSEVLQRPKGDVFPSPARAARLGAVEIAIEITDEVGLRNADFTPQTGLTRSFVGPTMIMAGVVSVGLAGLAWHGVSADHLPGWWPPPDQVLIPPRAVTVHDEVVSVGSFSLAREELDVYTWKRCVQSGECAANATLTEGDQPMIGLTFDDAQAVCAWEGGRLPSLAEWTSATGTQRWPWGSSPPTCDHAIALGCGFDLPMAPGTTRAGRTIEGVVNLAGNAWEWTVDGDRGVLMGGSVGSTASELGRQGALVPREGERPRFAGARCAWDM